MKLDLALMTQGDANEDTSGDIAMDEFSIDTLSTSEIFHPTAPAQHLSRHRSNQQQQHHHQAQRRHTNASTAGSSNNSRSQRSFHTRTTVPASADNPTDASSARSNGSATTMPAFSSGNGYSDAGSHKGHLANNGSIPPIVEMDDDVEEPLFPKNPISPPRPAAGTEAMSVDRTNNQCATSNSSRGTSKVAPTGQRLTTLQHLRLKHQMRNAAATAAVGSTQTTSTTTPAAACERVDSRTAYENQFNSDEERDNLLARMKYESAEMSRDSNDGQPRKVYIQSFTK